MALGRKTGGRTKGTPNKDKPLKAMLREHSLGYFSPNPENPDGMSDFDRDMLAMPPTDRADAELKLLRFHTPQMQATAVDITLADGKRSLAERLAALADENEDQ
ncbi:MAG: hypothetical protein JFR41_08235 [Muribaculaceae bacterium]|nr:hypothetical protein [Muribaculaceae bacterium]